MRQASLGAESMIPEIDAKMAAKAKSMDAVEPKEAPIAQPDEEYLRAAAIPLPMGGRDLAEILIVGLADYSDDEADDETAAKEKHLRPKSLMIPPAVVNLPLPRKRANSLPTPSASPYRSPPDERTVASAKQPENATSETSVPAEDALKVDAKISARAKRRSIRPISTVIANAGRPVPILSASDIPTEVESSDEEAEELDEFAEEPEILTSSRVSISGRSNSPTVSDHGRPLSVNPGFPTRTSSVHSIRVIEMAGPRSPATSRSRNSSVEAQDHASMPRVAAVSRTSSLSRTGSISTSPRVEELRNGAEPSPGLRNSGIMAKALRPHAAESISEAEEVAELTGTPTTESVSTPASAPGSATRFEDLQSRLQSSHAIFGSVVRHSSSSPPRSPASPLSPTQGATKVTILNSTRSPSVYYAKRKGCRARYSRQANVTLRGHRPPSP